MATYDQPMQTGALGTVSTNKLIRNTYTLRLRNKHPDERPFRISISSDARLKLALEGSETLEVIADDKGIKADLPAWCRTTGNECLSVEEKNGEFHVLVKKK